jgi:hypothetical protein
MEKSLVKCKELSGSDASADDIFKSAFATAFFGTPHRGLLVDDILSMTNEMEEERIDLVRSIGGGDNLRDELENFISLAPGLKILSFYEQMKGKRLKKDVCTRLLPLYIHVSLYSYARAKV